MELVKDKVVFITGGTRGIGFAAAKKFIENGAHVAIAGHAQETVDAALAKLKELYPDCLLYTSSLRLKSATFICRLRQAIFTPNI